MSLSNDLERILAWEHDEKRVFPHIEIMEPLSATLHAVYQREARRQGEGRHPDDYETLPEHTKEYDRVLARFILHHACVQDCIAMIHDSLVEEETP